MSEQKRKAGFIKSFLTIFTVVIVFFVIVWFTGSPLEPSIFVLVAVATAVFCGVVLALLTAFLNQPRSKDRE